MSRLFVTYSSSSPPSLPPIRVTISHTPRAVKCAVVVVYYCRTYVKAVRGE